MGDETEFTAVVDRYRGELRVHCYRMLGSFDEAEDLVQEIFLRAWKGRDGFQGRSSVRAWLYRIATNACLDALRGRARRVLPHHLAPPSDPALPQAPRGDIAWLQPFPDRLRPPAARGEPSSHGEPVAPRGEEPEPTVVARETLELAFLAAIQHLPPRQRAAVILHDVLGWPARQTAEALDASVASINSALQRARTTLREHLPPHRSDWAPSTPPSEAQRALLRRYMSAVERGDIAEIGTLLAEQVRTTMPPYPMWFAGREAVLGALAASRVAGSPGYGGAMRMVATAANGQLAAAAYLRAPGRRTFDAFTIGVFGFDGDRIAEITAFHDPALFPAFDLPSRLTDEFFAASRSQES